MDGLAEPVRLMAIGAALPPAPSQREGETVEWSSSSYTRAKALTPPPSGRGPGGGSRRERPDLDTSLAPGRIPPCIWLLVSAVICLNGGVSSQTSGDPVEEDNGNRDAITGEAKPRDRAIFVLAKMRPVHRGMMEVLKRRGLDVATFELARLQTEAERTKLAKSLDSAALLVLGKDIQEKPAIGRLFASRDWRTRLRGFLQSGGVVFSLVAWVYSDAWTGFFREAGVWYPDLAPIKPFLKYRQVFPSGGFRPSPAAPHRLLTHPHRLTGIFGYQNFGYSIPARKDLHGIIVRADNSKCVGVSLQEGVQGKGAVIFTNLFLFMADNKEGTGPQKAPLARHSSHFLENLAAYARDRRPAGKE